LLTDGVFTTVTQVNVDIELANFEPVAVEDVISTTEDSKVIIPFTDLLANDNDANGDLLTIESVSNAVNGAITINQLTSEIEFTPDADFNGSASFDYVVSDGKNTASSSVTISITPENDAPVVSVGFSDLSLGEDAPLHLVIPDDAFTDIDGDQLEYTARLSDGSSLPDWLIFDGKVFSGMPLDGDSGVYNINVVANDGEKSANTNFKLTVNNNGGFDSLVEGDDLTNNPVKI
jgi:hypothetical protein